MATYGQYDYQQALLTASKSMIRVKDPITLLRLISRFIDRQIGATHVGILLYDKKQNTYVMIDSKGESGSRIPVGFVQIPIDDPIIQYFKAKRSGTFDRKEALVFSELEHIQNFEMLVKKKEKMVHHIEKMRKQMELLRAAICIPSIYKKELVAVLILGDKLTGEPYIENEIHLFVTLANDVAMAIKNAELIKDLQGAYDKERKLLMDTAGALAAAIEARDKYTKGHSERVSHYTLVIAAELIRKGMVPASSDFLESAQLSGLLHDVGKIGIKDTILNKPARLNDEEFLLMKAHVKIGGNILKPIEGLKDLCDGALYHHERWDGKGYPFGLKAEKIPLLGRIVCIVDSYDTMITKRPYATPMTPEQAFEELRRCAGTQFDPTLVEVFADAYKAGSLKKRDYKLLKFHRRH